MFSVLYNKHTFLFELGIMGEDVYRERVLPSTRSAGHRHERPYPPFDLPPANERNRFVDVLDRDKRENRTEHLPA